MDSNFFESGLREGADFNAEASNIEQMYPLPPPDFHFSGNVGATLDFRGRKETPKIGIPTDCGVVADKGQELLTEKVFGCSALLFKGKKSNAFFHLTPNSRLGYRYFKYPNQKEELIKNSASRVVEGLPQDELQNYEVTMVVNIGSEDGRDYDYRKVLADAQNFAEQLKSRGIKSVRVIEVPLDSTTVYYSEKNPDKMFACGNKTNVNENGGLEYIRQVKSLWIDLEPIHGAEYVTHNV